ncbi:hypothetical protein MTR_2g088110 [Medicago truncatula]|uniref:Uncharacterized protein n=1 Tax=Medicago truncatula TaxID=3880 RepID=G7ITW9_MEDTR|nr:hypothetical protein MTR_2g088110 [Medicago truncatula]
MGTRKVKPVLGGPSTSRLEQSHKQEKHHTLTQNLKEMGLWVLLLIRCSTFTILSDVGHITHTCKPTLPLKCESIDRRPQSHPSSNRGSDTTVGSQGELGGPSTSRLEQPYKQERHHTLTQNLKAMSLWVPLLIRCSTFTILFDVGHITHTCKPTKI